MGVAWMTPERFYAKAVRVGDCLILQSRARIGPYGLSGYKGKVWLAHRLSYFFATGETPEVVLHMCDTPLCVEPDHLRGGTHADNVEDKVSKNRHPHHDSHPMARLTQEDVDQIRSLFASKVHIQTLVEQFGVSRSQIYRIVNRERWS